MLFNNNINGINSPLKKYRLADSIRNQDQSLLCLQETYLNSVIYTIIDKKDGKGTLRK